MPSHTLKSGEVRKYANSRDDRSSPHKAMGLHGQGPQPKVPPIPEDKPPAWPCPNCGARGWCGHGGRVAP